MLIVDDEPQIGKIFGLNLKLAGYDVVTTTCGAEAVELARTQPFDVILLDLVMPGLTGMEVLDRVRAFSRVPVIIFTARADIFEKVRRFGADDYIAKPLDLNRLIEKIKNLTGENK